MKQFKICFEIAEARLPTIVSLLSGEVGNLNITEVNDPIKRRTKKHRNNDPKETVIGRIVMQILKDKENHQESEFHPPVVEAGFSISSVSPIMSRLVANGDVARTWKQSYKLT